jgi:hypothetical protein
MSRINHDAFEQSTSPLSAAVESNPQVIMHAGMPMLMAGVNRKVNIGNYENIDVYCAISVPIMLVPGQDPELFKAAVAEAADLGFQLASRETAGRYMKIKEMQRGGRETAPK